MYVCVKAILLGILIRKLSKHYDKIKGLLTPLIFKKSADRYLKGLEVCTTVRFFYSYNEIKSNLSY